MISDNLNTGQLKLRPFAPNDAADVLRYWQSDPGWERFNASVPQNFDLNDAKAFVAEMRSRSRDSQPNWAVVYETSVIGVVSLTLEQGNRIAVIGYGVHSKVRGQGFAVAATSLVISKAFSHYSQLQKIRAHTNGANLPSMRVLDKLGFTREGLLRSNQFVKGRFSDEAIYGLLRDEWVM